jgi:hypothetical protein
LNLEHAKHITTATNINQVRIVLYIFAILLLSCQGEKDNSLFHSLRGKEEVEIRLSMYKLDSVPPEIGDLKGVKKLYISRDSAQGWTSYPPLSALGDLRAHPPYRYLPHELTELTSLQRLTLIDLDLVTLPEDFDKLQNLDTLVLFMNKLTVSKEIAKLKKLKRLKYLRIFGNKVTADDLAQLKRSNPGLRIDVDLR